MKRLPPPSLSLPPRPAPPETLFEWRDLLTPAIGLSEWVSAVILDMAGPLYNPDHAHLVDASIGYLWTNVENIRQQRQVLGMAEKVQIMGAKWAKARQEMQISDWFGQLPDFMITLDANYCRDCTDLEFCALVEHELYHCAQALDEFGSPKFGRDGTPKYALRGHDVEEFTGIVRRYGIGDPEGPLADMIIAAAAGPTISNLNIARACGTCMLKVV